MRKTVFNRLPTRYQIRMRALEMRSTVFNRLPASYQTRVRALVHSVADSRDQTRVGALRALANSFTITRGFMRYQDWQPDQQVEASASSAYVKSSADTSNPLQTYFDSHTEGRGIWKWKHYFEIYHRHFSKFIGQDVNILEIGVYSGGSLEMWKQYFGSKSRIYGVDTEEACKSYADDSVEIFVGDQADRNFWRRFKMEVPLLDIIIDDGGHLPYQQMVTLEEMLTHLRPGGVYLCEDVQGQMNRFAGYINGLSLNLNTFRPLKSRKEGHGERLVCSPTPFQSSVHSVHLYPFVAVIEKSESPVKELVSIKHGTEWQPFL
jgi:23S rRNA U2552 (ribose-2'-O)-methylase RlmE/FtsJ